MISAWRKSTVSSLGFIHFKVSVPPAKTTPSPLLSYIIEKWIRDGWCIYPLGFIHYWVNVWRPWGNGVPPWASYFSHAICKLTFSNRRCPPLCSYITKNVWRGGGVYKTPGEGDILTTEDPALPLPLSRLPLFLSLRLSPSPSLSLSMSLCGDTSCVIRCPLPSSTVHVHRLSHVSSS